MQEFVRSVTACVIIGAPLLVIAYDIFVFFVYGHTTTITDVIRGWNEVSVWPEMIYVIGVVLLYLHLYRRVL